MPACLFVNSTIIPRLMVVKSLKTILILFPNYIIFPVLILIPCIDIVFLYSYRSSISVLFSCIRTDRLYRYHFPIFIPIPCIGIVFLYWKYMIVILTMLLLNTWLLHAITWPCLLSPDACLISLITWHLTTCLVIIIFRESCPDILYYIQWPVFLVLVCSCYFCNSWTCPVPSIPVIW